VLSASTRDEEDPAESTQLLHYPSNVPRRDGFGELSWCCLKTRSLGEGFNQGEHTETGLLLPQSSGWEFAGAGREPRDETRWAASRGRPNQTVVTVSRHRDRRLREGTRRFPHSNHFIKSPAGLLLSPNWIPNFN